MPHCGMFSNKYKATPSDDLLSQCYNACSAHCCKGEISAEIKLLKDELFTLDNE